MVAPHHRRELVQQVVAAQDISVRLACETFGISETCYRYQATLSDENTEIAAWLLRLTQS